MVTTPSREERYDRYRAGLCVDCGQKPYSAGRPRCEECHRKHVRPYEPGLTPARKGAAG